MGNVDATQFAERALRSYDLDAAAQLRLISLSENATYLVESDSPLGVLRVYRAGYQSDLSKQSEIAWISALRESKDIDTPAVVLGKGGEALQHIEIDSIRRSCVLFEYVDGEELADEDLFAVAAVGRAAGLLHKHVEQWQRPPWFERPTWNVEDILGPQARWGNWRNGPGLSKEGRILLESVESRLRERLEAYRQEEYNSGLVHGDLRAANVMAGKDGRLWVIDFDDCGFSWYLWDLCSTTTFIEHLPQVDEIVLGWLRGYSEIRSLTTMDIDIIPDLVMLRRLHVLAWLGSHPESDLAHKLQTSYTEATYQVARSYMNGEFLSRVSSEAVLESPR